MVRDPFDRPRLCGQLHSMDEPRTQSPMHRLSRNPVTLATVIRLGLDGTRGGQRLAQPATAPWGGGRSRRQAAIGRRPRSRRGRLGSGCLRRRPQPTVRRPVRGRISTAGVGWTGEGPPKARATESTNLMGSASLLLQDGLGSGWRVSTPLIGPGEVSRQTVRPLVVRRRGQLMGCRAPASVVSTWTIRSLSSPRCRCRVWTDECPKGTEGDDDAVRG